MGDPWAEPTGEPQGSWGSSHVVNTTPRRGSFLAASVEKIRVDSENVPLTALAGRSGKTPNKRMTMGGPTMVPYTPRSPSSPLANRSNNNNSWDSHAPASYGSGYHVGSPPSAPSAPPSAHGNNMGPPPPVSKESRRQSMMPSIPAHKYVDNRGNRDGSSGGAGGVGQDHDPWGHGTNWTKESTAAQAQASKRRHSTYVGGTSPTPQQKGSEGQVNMPPGMPSSRAGGVSYAAPPPSSHSVPSSPWGSPGKSYYGVTAPPMVSPPSAPPPPSGVSHGNHSANISSHRSGMVSAPVSPPQLNYGHSQHSQQQHGHSQGGQNTSPATAHWSGRPTHHPHGHSGGAPHTPGAGGQSASAPSTRHPSPSAAYLKGLQNQDQGHGDGWGDINGQSQRLGPGAPHHSPYAQQYPGQSHALGNAHQHQLHGSGARSGLHLESTHQSLYRVDHNAVIPAAPSMAVAGAAPDGCYLGPWRGDERARVLAYEACLQACLEGSLGTNAPQHKVDMAVHFLADRCAELRRGFGMDGIVVGSKGNVVGANGGFGGEFGGSVGAGHDGHEEFGSGAGKPKEIGNNNIQTTPSCMDPSGGQRWSGVTIDVTEVSITTRGWKRFTGGVHPKDVINAARQGGARAAAAAASASAPTRGDVCRVRADGGGGMGVGDMAMLHVGRGDARIRLNATDETLVFEVDLGGGKWATARPSLEDVAQLSSGGRNLVELPLKLQNGKEKGYVRFTAHLEPIGGYDWGAPLTSLDHNHGNKIGSSGVGGSDWAMSAGNGPLPSSAAYDVALGAALRALGFHRRRFALHGPWAWLLRELAELQGVSPNHTSLRYVRHVLAVATPTADCLSSILDHLAPCLKESMDGRLTATEANQLDGIRTAVEQLVGVCFQNYKNLSEEEPRGIAKDVPQQVPAPALGIALELSRILQRDPLAPDSMRVLQNHLQTAAKACYRRHHSVFVSDRNRIGIGLGDDPRFSHVSAGNSSSGGDTDGAHARLFAALSALCMGLCRELGTDHTIQDAGVLPVGVRLPQLAAGVYCTETAACVSKLLSAFPPPAPPCAEALDLVDSLCELQEAAAAADVSDAYGTDGYGHGGYSSNGHNHYHGGHHPPYPGVGGASAATALDPRALFQPHVTAWIEAARETLLKACVDALGKHGVGGIAMEEAYREAHSALEGFERVVARWPDTAVALEEVLADADRLLLQRVSGTVEDTPRGGLFRGFGASGGKDEGHHCRSLQDEGTNHTNRGHHNGTGYDSGSNVVGRMNGMGSPVRPGGVGASSTAMDRLRAGRAAAAAAAAAVARGVGHAAEKARSKFQENGGLGGMTMRAGGNTGAIGDLGGGSHLRLSSTGPNEGFVPRELALALTALKTMEVLRPEVSERLTLWVAAAGGGQRAAGEEFGRRQVEVLGELRAQYAAHLRRAVSVVATAGPSLLGALRSAALKPLGSEGNSKGANGISNAATNHQSRGGLFNRNNESGSRNGEYGEYNGVDQSARCDENGGEETCEEASTRDELDAVVAPILAHIETVAAGLRRSIPQRRALVGVLRGLWNHLGGEALRFIEEDLRQRSSWRMRLMAVGACERVSTLMSGTIRDTLGHDVKDKDLDPPATVKRLGDLVGGAANESVQVY